MHLGRNVSKIRELKGIKQDEFAKLLKISQQAISKLENRKEIDEGTLGKIAEKLGTTIDSIKEFNPESIIQTVHQHSGNQGSGFTINPLDKIIELYEKLLKEKDTIIKSQKKEIEIKNIEIDALSRNAKK